MNTLRCKFLGVENQFFTYQIKILYN